MKALLAAGCDAEAVDSSRETGLMLAVLSGQAALLMPCLLAGGPPLEVRNKCGFTVLLWACFQDQAHQSWFSPPLAFL